MPKHRLGGIKKKKTRLSSRIICLILSILVAMSSMVIAVVSTGAEETDTRVVDNSTLDDWKLYFGEDVDNTENAGGIWTDKSVFTDAQNFCGSNNGRP